MSLRFRPAPTSSGTWRRRGWPTVTAKVILQLVDAEQPPLRLFVGSYPYPVAEKVYQNRLATWQEWRWLAEQA